MKVERNSYGLSLKKWKFDVKNCEVEVIILVKRNAAFHDFYSERHSNLCGKLVNFRTLCNCYIIPSVLKTFEKSTALLFFQFAEINPDIRRYTHRFQIVPMAHAWFCFQDHR